MTPSSSWLFFTTKSIEKNLKENGIFILPVSNYMMNFTVDI